MIAATVDHCIIPPLSAVTKGARDKARKLSPNELRARRHVVYTFLMERCLKPEGSLYHAPSQIAEIVLVGEITRAFDGDLRFVPGFFYNPHREYWQLNTKPGTFLEPYFDERGFTAGFYVRRSLLDSRPYLLTSKGLPLGTEAIKPQ